MGLGGVTAVGLVGAPIKAKECQRILNEGRNPIAARDHVKVCHFRFILVFCVNQLQGLARHAWVACKTANCSAAVQ